MFNLADFGKLGVVGGLSEAQALYDQAALYIDFTQNAARINGSWSAAIPLLTTTRASVAQMDSTTGFWGQFAANAPRFSDKGLLVEEARTNGIRNNTMAGTVAGSPGTVPTNWQVASTGGAFTRTVVGAGTENGVDYVEIRFQFTGAFTVNVGYEGTTQLAAVQGNLVALSHFVSITAGDLTNITLRSVLSERAAGGASSGGLTNPLFTVTTGNMQRVVATRTLTDATCAFVQARLDVIATGVGDVTLRIGWPQFEIGGLFETSPIKTSTVAVTRPADVISMTISGYTADHTMFAEAQAPGGPVASGSPALVQIDNGTLAERSLILRTAGTIFGSGNTLNGNVTQANPVVGIAWPNYAIRRLAYGVKLNDFATVLAGSAPVMDVAGTIPLAPNRMLLGSNSAAYCCCYIRVVALWTSRLTNAQLQAITR